MGKNIDQDQNKRKGEETDGYGNARSKGVGRTIGLSNKLAAVTRKITLSKSKHDDRWEVENLKNIMEREGRKKSNSSRLDICLDVVLQNIEQETPIAESGKSEEESNMDAPTPVGKNIDQNQNEGEKKESNVLATREAKELAAQLGWATFWR